MSTVTTSLVDKAERVFTDLGYVVDSDGEELQARRKWRVVQVTPVDSPAETPESGELRCFVTWQENAGEIRERLRQREPDYEWALVGVDEGGEYEVHHAPQASVSA